MQIDEASSTEEKIQRKKNEELHLKNGDLQEPNGDLHLKNVKLQK